MNKYYILFMGFMSGVNFINGLYDILYEKITLLTVMSFLVWGWAIIMANEAYELEMRKWVKE